MASECPANDLLGSRGDDRSSNLQWFSEILNFSTHAAVKQSLSLLCPSKQESILENAEESTLMPVKYSLRSVVVNFEICPACGRFPLGREWTHGRKHAGIQNSSAVDRRTSPEEETARYGPKGLEAGCCVDQGPENCHC